MIAPILLFDDSDITTLLVVGLLLLTGIIVYFRTENKKLKDEISNYQKTVNIRVAAEVDRFKRNELGTFTDHIRKAEEEKSKYELAQWKLNVESALRQDAIAKSRGVTFGKVTEHLIPYWGDQFAFNPSDTRFIGSPIDLMVFQGATENSNEIAIWFIEVKTGKSQLTEVQKKIKRAIDEGRVFWKQINVAALK